MKRHRWIVVGTDFSATAALAIEWAAALAVELGACVACVHAYDDRPDAPLRSDAGPTLLARMETTLAPTRVRFPMLRMECFVRRGTPWDKLINVATELGADLMVVGASGEHEGTHPSFLGRVAMRLAGIATRAVLIVPASAVGAPPSITDEHI